VMNKSGIGCENQPTTSNGKTQYQDRDWLSEQYQSLKSIYAIAKICGCHPRTIHSWLIRHGISRNKNRNHSEETRRKMSIANKGRPSGMLGKKHSDETKRKMSEGRKGPLNGNWRDGATERIRKFRRTKEYIRWRKQVIESANGRCQKCGLELPLEAHHIVSIHKDWELALELSNGMALCKECHLKEGKRNDE